MCLRISRYTTLELTWTKSKGRWPHKELRQMRMFIHNAALVKINVSRMTELDRIL